MPAAPKAFLTAEWRNLVMVNYEVDPSLLQKRLPKGTEIDFWNGRTYVSLVGFRFLETRVLGRRVPFHINFDEVNLRFYVRHKAGNGWRRGVVFVKEIVPRLAIALVARWAYNEQYVALPMKSVLELPTSANNQQGSVSYSWKWAGQWQQISAQISGQPSPWESGSQIEFITEHYWGYAAQRDGSTLEYQVEHPPWRVWQADRSQFTGNVTTLYGAEFTDLLSSPPSSAFVAEGSEIMVRHGLPTRIG
jgi:uncharacterized protein YqjF (DUF2071 family)